MLQDRAFGSDLASSLVLGQAQLVLLPAARGPSSPSPMAHLGAERGHEAHSGRARPGDP